MIAKKKMPVARGEKKVLPRLVDVLCALAANWVLCECGLKIGKSGLDGWEKKGLRLGEEIDSLTDTIKRTKARSRKAELNKRLSELESQSTALTAEWQQAHDEVDERASLFWDARKFCTRELGIGDGELLNAAIVGFDPERLPLGHGPSKERMSELTNLLSNLNRNRWKSQPWANPTKPRMRTTKRVTPDRQASFIAQNVTKVDSFSVQKESYLGLVFNDDLTVTRLGDAYQHSIAPISLSYQQFRILRFVHNAGVKGRTKAEMDAQGFTSLKQEKNENQ